MSKIKTFGFIFIFISILLSITNIFYIKITGAIIGAEVKNSFLTVLTLGFFFVGLLFLSGLEKRVSNWIKAVAIAGVITSPSISNSLNNSKNNDYKKDDSKNKSNVENVAVTSSWKTTQGKFERTYRWDEILDEVEAKYGIPQGKLKGLAMRESYGDPLRLNENNDGGAGLFMFQPRIAKHYGLKVYGSSDRSSADIKHGAELKKLIEKNNHDYAKMTEIDERFDIRKSAEAAARYLKEDFNKYGSWDKALSAYNQGKPAPNAGETKHVKAVNEYAQYYNEKDKKDEKYYTSKLQKVNAKGHSNKKYHGKR